MSDHIERNPETGSSQEKNQGTGSAGKSRSDQPDLIALLDECLEAFPDGDPRQRLLLKLRHAVLQGAVHLQEKDAELRKLQAVVEKLTAPANRIGILLDLPGEGLARIAVGGAEYYTTVDPRVNQDDLKIGTQILVNGYVAVHYPAGIRATALGWALGVGRAGAIVGPLFGGWVLASGIGFAWNFVGFAVPALAGALLIALMPRRRAPAVQRAGRPVTAQTLKEERTA